MDSNKSNIGNMKLINILCLIAIALCGLGLLITPAMAYTPVPNVVETENRLKAKLLQLVQDDDFHRTLDLQRSLNHNHFYVELERNQTVRVDIDYNGITFTTPRTSISDVTMRFNNIQLITIKNSL